MLALVIGSAKGVEDEVAEATQAYRFDAVLATNSVVADFPWKIDVAVSLHPKLMVGWRETRTQRNYPVVTRYVSHRKTQGGKTFDFVTDVLEFKWPEQTVSGSSGHYAIKAAVELLGADKVVLAGVPMVQQRKHYYTDDDWNASIFLPAWEQTRERLKDTVRSMSGWTAELFGKPTQEWAWKFNKGE